MANIIEILDALPGCGKTHAIFDYMNRHHIEKWIYLSPMKTEINERVPREMDRTGMDFFIAEDRDKHEEYKTKVLQVKEALLEGRNIACTHNLMLRFGKEHFDIIQLQGYNIVCDEELELITGYKGVSGKDITLLLENNSIEIDSVNGKVTCPGDILVGTKYDNFKRYADHGCMYAAIERNQFLVLQISPDMIHAANRFILLTYNYPGSIMDMFMQFNNITHKELEGVSTNKTSKEIIKQVSELVTFIETPSVKKWHNRKNTLSATWWRTSVTEEIVEDLNKVVSSLMRYTKINSEETMITLPKNNITGYNEEGKKVKRINPPRLSMEDSYVVYNARATNEYAHKELCIHMLNLYPNQSVKVYLQDKGFICNDDVYALNTFIQWLFRSRIRENKNIKVAILSSRTSSIFKEWLLNSREA